MANGVTLVDPATTYIDVDVRIGRDTVIRPATFLEGETRIGAGCRIGPSTRIVDSRVGDGSEVTFAVVLGSTIGRDVTVGPFVRMRPGVVLADGRQSGAFVDLKEREVGRGSKVPHLSYVGDADLGEDVNIGAGNGHRELRRLREAPDGRSTTEPASVPIPCWWRRFAWARAP